MSYLKLLRFLIVAGGHVFTQSDPAFEIYLLDKRSPREPRARTEADALAEGLTIFSPGSRGKRATTPTLVPGCERCDPDPEDWQGAMHPRGERFCLKCRAEVKREMRAVGYLR